VTNEDDLRNNHINKASQGRTSAVDAPLMAQPSIVYVPMFYPTVEPKKPQLRVESIN